MPKDPDTVYTVDIEPSDPKISLLKKLRNRIFGNKETLERSRLIKAVTSQLQSFDEQHGFPRKDGALDQPMPPISPEMTELAELGFNDSVKDHDRSLLKGVYDYNREVIKPMYHGNSPVFAKYGFLNLSAPTSATWYESFSNMVYPLKG